MAVTADKYELPIAVCETATELGRLLNIPDAYIRNAVCMNRTGKYKGVKYIKVIIDDD